MSTILWITISSFNNGQKDDDDDDNYDYDDDDPIVQV